MSVPVKVSIRAVLIVGKNFLEYADPSGCLQRIDLTDCARRFAASHAAVSSGRCIG